MSNQNIINSIPAPLPVDYDRQNSFTDYSIQNPGQPISGSQLDIEFNAVEAALDQTQARLRLIQRDDGAVLNGAIGLDQLKNEALIGVNPPDTWAPFNDYQVSDTAIVDQGQWYLCTESHVASAVFADDLAAGFWRILIDLTPFTTEAENWATLAEDVPVSEGDGTQFSALHHAAKALASEVAAASSATNSANSAAASQTSRLASETARDASQTAQGLSESARDASQAARDTSILAASDSSDSAAESGAFLYDFKGRWFGGLASDPLVDLNGNALNAGDAYFNTTLNKMKTYNGATWQVSTANASDIGFDATGLNTSATSVQQAVEAALIGRKNLIINGNKIVNQQGSTSLTELTDDYNYDTFYYDGTYVYVFVEDVNVREGVFTLSWESDATAEWQLIANTETSADLSAITIGWTAIANEGQMTLGGIADKHLWVRFAAGTDGLNALNNVQLEEGSVKTDFEYRFYENEESLVQTSFEIQIAMVRGYGATDDVISSSVYYKPKRVVPTVTVIPPYTALNADGENIPPADISRSHLRYEVSVIATGNAFSVRRSLRLDSRP